MKSPNSTNPSEFTRKQPEQAYLHITQRTPPKPWRRVRTFLRPSTRRLGVVLLCLLGFIQPASAQTFARVTNELHFAQSDAGAFVWFDFDNDGWADVLCSGGWRGGYGNRLFHNNRDGTFTQVAETNFAGRAARTYWATVADFNDDGFLDVIAGNGSEAVAANPVLYLNQGASRFTMIKLDPSAILGGTDVRAWGVAALDYNRDGLADLALARWDTAGKNYLLKNTGGGVFAAVTNTAWTLQGSSDPVSSADYDGDAAPDLLGLGVSRTFVFRNAGAGDFTQVTNSLLSTFQSATSLNSAWGDFDNDGDLDVAITYVVEASTDLQVFLNDGSGNFTLGFSAAAACQNAYCADYDNDGRLDIYATGWRSRLYRNLGGGAFTEVLNEPPVMDSWGQWPTAAWGDYNNDGFLDLLVGATGSVNALYRNSTNGNHWLKVKLISQISNRAAIGAVVRVKATIGGQEVWQMRVVQAQSGLADLVPHFGLGDATNVDLVRIEWPSGNVQEASVGIDRVITVTETVRINPPRPTASLGGSVNLTNISAGTAYQWRFNGVDLAGETSRTLALENLTLAAAGRYSVVVTLNNGTVQTNHTYLNVDPTFTKITQADLDGPQYMWIPYWVDLDGDDWLELVVAGANTLVYTNNHDGTLSRTWTHDLSQMSLVELFAIAWADLDNDGDLDGFAGGSPTVPGAYLRNDGDGRFTKIVADGSWTANGIAVSGIAPTCADFDNDGILDLLVGYYGNAVSGFWGTNSVLRGLGDGRFEVDRNSPLALSHTWLENWSWADWNGDGRLDLFGATSWDSTTVDLMFENRGGGQFLRITNSPLVQRDLDIAASWGDYDNDGRLDVCIPNWNRTNLLWRNLGGGVFEPDPATPVFPVGQSPSMAAWGDYDNDGWPDLFISHQNRPSRLFHNRGDGTFEEITTGSPVTEAKGYSAVWADYDNDGFLDLSVVNTDSGMTYLYRSNLRNVGNTSGWLKVKLAGTASNRDGIGATIRVKASIGGKEFWQMRQIVCQTYEAALLAHFGLGDATSVTTLRIEWPSGTVQELANVTPNQILTVIEPRRPVLAVAVTPTQVTGTLMGDTNQVYQIHMTDDLATGWTVLTNATTDASGKGNWSDPGVAPQGRRFYRALKIP